MSNRWPNLFMVGAPKAGTTSLHRYLQEHPQVFMSRFKEPGYFAPDVVTIKQDRRMFHPKDEADYLKLFSNADGAVRVGESSTMYLMSREAPRLIHDIAPDARIIVMVRNPVDLLYSFHNQRLTMGVEPFEDFRKVVEVDGDRRSGKLATYGVTGYGVAYKDRALLGEQVERWMKQFGADRVHVIVYDDFMKDTAGEYARVLEFLGVDKGFRPETFAVFNTSHAPRKTSILVLNPVTRWLGRTALPALIGESRTSSLGRRLDIRRLNRRKRERVPLDPDLRRQLESEYQDDVALLGTLIGRDLRSEWFAQNAH